MSELQPIAVSAPAWTREHPYPARLHSQYRLTGATSIKDVRHVEIDLGNSGIRYQPGDTLGIWVQNQPDLITRILALCGLSANTEVTVDDAAMSLFDALSRHYELTQVHPGFIKRYATLQESGELQALTADPASLRTYLANRQIIEVLRQFPQTLHASQLLECLRRMTPRQYSIASSPLVSPDHIALTIAHVQFDVDAQKRQGAASGFLAERVVFDTRIPVFPVENPNFRLPADPTTALIMIGPGTGIAPFRAFLQHREALGATGMNWLIFGNPHRSTDYLYEAELQGFADRGVLHKLSTAFSRDQGEKRYVQHLMLEQAQALFTLLEQGAAVYVCGDAKRMAEDVQNALLEIIGRCGDLEPAAARQYLVRMRQEKRYQRDVY